MSTFAVMLRMALIMGVCGTIASQSSLRGMQAVRRAGCDTEESEVEEKVKHTMMESVLEEEKEESLMESVSESMIGEESSIPNIQSLKPSDISMLGKNLQKQTPKQRDLKKNLALPSNEGTFMDSFDVDANKDPFQSEHKGQDQKSHLTRRTAATTQYEVSQMESQSQCDSDDNNELTVTLEDIRQSKLERKNLIKNFKNPNSNEPRVVSQQFPTRRDPHVTGDVTKNFNAFPRTQGNRNEQTQSMLTKRLFSQAQGKNLGSHWVQDSLVDACENGSPSKRNSEGISLEPAALDQMIAERLGSEMMDMFGGEIKFHRPGRTYRGFKQFFDVAMGFPPKDILRLVKILGAGFMGLVILTEVDCGKLKQSIDGDSPEANRHVKVALKIPFEVEEATKEAMLLHKVKGSNHVTQTYGTPVETGIFMEFVDGQDLGSALTQQEESPACKFGYVLDYLKGLDDIHQRSISHGDLYGMNGNKVTATFNGLLRVKANATSGCKNEAVVTDLGIAKRRRSPEVAWKKDWDGELQKFIKELNGASIFPDKNFSARFDVLLKVAAVADYQQYKEALAELEQFRLTGGDEEGVKYH